MKVIERKEPPNKWPREFRCHGNDARQACGSLLEVDASDITQPGQRDGDVGWFRCPVCRELTYVSKADTHDAMRYVSVQKKPGAKTTPPMAQIPRSDEGRGHDCNYA